MSHWWQQLAQRERSMLVATAATLLVFACWLGIWRPLERVRQGTVEQLQRQQADIQWMRAAASEVARLSSGKPVRMIKGNQSLLSLAEQTAREAGLGNAFRGGEPAARGQVRVRLEGASFGALVTWLEQLESERGISVMDSNLERTGVPGMVNVRLLLAES